MSETKSRHHKAQEFEEFFHKKIGQITMCWNPIPAQSVFESSECKKFAGEILERIKTDGENWHIQQYRDRELKAWREVDSLRLEVQYLKDQLNTAVPEFNIEDHACSTGDCPHEKQNECDEERKVGMSPALAAPYGEAMQSSDPYARPEELKPFGINSDPYDSRN